MMVSNKRRHGRIICCALALAAIATAPVAAFAGSGDILIEGQGKRIASRTIAVSTAGLDLNSAQAQRKLEDRIARAAKRACGSTSVNSLEEVGDYFTCRDQALNEARQELQQLSAVRSASHGGASAITAGR